jgi:hypothetical protein
VSLEAQRAKVDAHAQLYELELVEVVIDASVSAKTAAPHLSQLVTAIVATDRLWRSDSSGQHSESGRL